MHKCPNCGTEYDGNFCPECGSMWQEDKNCPRCGALLNGSAKFCNQCGYSFTQQPPAQPKQPSAFKQKLNAALAWVKKHLKIVIPTAIALVAVIVILSCIPTFILMGKNGTYYLSRGDEYDEDEYFILKNGKWTDETGASGKYSLSGDEITFYVYDEIFGETEEVKGTVSNGVLTIELAGLETTYRTEWHTHSFSEWEVTFAPSCTTEGLQRRSCACGKKETEKVSPTGHLHFENGYCTACGTIQLVYELNGDSYMVTGFVEGTENSTEVVILSEYNDLPVTSIASSAFEDCDSLTSVTIPDSVTSIKYYAFYGCSSLKSVHITNLVAWCNISFGNYSNPLIYAHNLYLNGNIIKELIIPDSVTSIGGSVFSGCSLTSITIPNSVTSIGSYAFEGCSGLTSITIPNSVTSIGNYAFDGCSSLTSITIPDSVTSIESHAFEDCSSLTSITIPDSMTSIGRYMFSGCRSLTSITIPDSVTSIESHAFSGCSSLTSITIPDSVTSIGSYAFDGCSSLTSITIPDSVTSIGDSSFYGCSGLTSITIPDGVTSIGSSAFSGCSGLTSITIPDGVTSIGMYAFSGCSELTSVTIPKSVTTIEFWAFNGCDKIIQTENGVQYVDKWAIGSDESVTSVSLRANTVGIGDRAFENCSSLTSITIPDSVTSIGQYAFEDCSSLTSITIPDSVTSIGQSAFEGCSSLTSVTIPDSVTSIESWVFEDCSSLTSITYNGTIAEWKAINKANDWDYKTGNYTVHCTDGTLNKNGNVIA